MESNNQQPPKCQPVVCENGHELKYAQPNPDPSRIRGCDVCGTPDSQRLGTWRCELCDFDLCFACYDKPQKPAPSVPEKSKYEREILVCDLGHELNFSRHEEKCSLCGKNEMLVKELGGGKVEIYQNTWRCKTCKVNFCHTCILKRVQENSPIRCAVKRCLMVRGSFIDFSLEQNNSTGRSLHVGISNSRNEIFHFQGSYSIAQPGTVYYQRWLKSLVIPLPSDLSDKEWDSLLVASLQKQKAVNPDYQIVDDIRDLGAKNDCFSCVVRLMKDLKLTIDG